MSDAHVVAQTIESTLDRQARTRESYEQEIARLSSQIIELRASVNFVQEAIDNFGKDEQREAEHLAELQKVLDACAAEEEEANKQIKKEREAAIKEAERIESVRPAYTEAQSEDWHRQNVALDEENFKKRLDYYEWRQSEDRLWDEVREVLPKALEKRKPKKKIAKKQA
jgi:chromosome segregation ATPase